MSVRLEDISKHLGLSISTVSKALNGYSDISPATKERIQEAATALGYHPNMAARNLRRQRTEKIGMVVNYPINIVDDFLSELIPGAALAAERADYNLILYTSVAQHPERISKICRAREVDGLLLLWPPQLEETLDLMEKEQIPYVVLPRRVPSKDVSYIAADHESGGRMLTQHLIELGHTRIGFTSRPEMHETNMDRYAGYCMALADAGIPLDESLVVETDGNDPQDGKRAIDTFLAMDVPPTAILFFTDPMAMQALAAANERGIRVPEELSIAGHDGILTSGLTVPALTTVRQPIPQMGRLALECLLARIVDHNLSAAQHILSVELVVRNSTGQNSP
ncbi:LacI family transcriptional regulator [Chloroflexi bacterium TSY]|nr:LacI family transcriptional regulator [Chloroflexi bacterium TSY]